MFAVLAVPAMAQEADEAADAATTTVQDEDALAVEAATVAALDWLALLDDAKYEESWQAGASVLQDNVTVEQWSTALKDARDPLEPFDARKLLESRKVTDPQGAPEGEYIFLHYRTQAANEQTVTETVVLVEEGDAWKVVGYFVQPEQAGQPG
jgi:hypothetical protein